MDHNTLKNYLEKFEVRKKISLEKRGRPPKFLPEYKNFLLSFLENSKGKFITSLDVKRELCKKFHLKDNSITRFTIRL